MHKVGIILFIALYLIIGTICFTLGYLTGKSDAFQQVIKKLKTDRRTTLK